MMAKLIYCIWLYILLDSCCNGFPQENANHFFSRIKRYEPFDDEVLDEKHQTKQSDECESWIRCILDFFLRGDENSSGGLFTRMISWVKNGWCRLMRQCDKNDNPIPSPDFPRPAATPSPGDLSPVNIPTNEPDAEITTPVEVKPEEKNETNDVQ